MFSLWILLIFGAGFLTLLLFKGSSKKVPPGLREVPGPKGAPLIGNTLQVSPTHPHRDFMKWAEEYGEIYKIQLGWNTWYMLNSPEAVKEILDRQSAASSSRAPMPVASDALSGGMRFLLMPYGPQWRRLRAVSHKLLTPKMSDTFQPSQDFESKQLLHDILTDNASGEEFYMHVRRYSTSVLMTSTYGRRVPKWECEDVREIYGLMKDFSDVAAPGRFLADTIPPLGNLPLPLQWWRKAVLPLQQRQAVIWMKYWTGLRTKMETKQAPECFVKQFIESDYRKENITELQGAFVAGSMIEAGSETTSSALNSSILYLAAHPHVIERAHDELSRVVGDKRSPTFSDMDSLPWIRAIVKEIVRMKPPTNMGTPHYTTADITYKGFFIPPGSVVAIQQYPIHYNSEYYSDPYTFKPERYLSYPLRAGAYAAGADPKKRDHFSFGAGRRICSGLHLAENSLFITVAKVLWAFNIRPPIGPDGKEIGLDISDDAYELGANTVPKPFKVRFIPRNETVEKTVREEWKVAVRDGFVLRDTKVDEEGVVIQ